MNDLRARVSRASAAQGITTLVGKAVNVLLAVVLARLLFPADYGLFAIAMVVTGLANMVSNFGFQSYIIQARELTPAALNTCFTLNVILSLGLGLIVAGVGYAWPFAPKMLPEILALYGVHVFLSGLSYIGLALLKRDLDFVRSSRIDLAYTVVSMGGRVGFAFAGFAALSFPLGDVLGSAVRWLIVRRVSRTSVRLTIPRGVESRAALSFGMHATAVALGSFVANQTDKLLLAANHTLAAVGVYTFGGSTAGIFYNAVIVPQTGVFLATFARLRDDLVEARRHLAVSSRLIFSLALPVSVLLIIEPARVVEVVFGTRWLASVPILQLFAFNYLVHSALSGITGLQMAFGLAASAARTKWLNASLFVAMLAGASWLGVGIVGYAIAYMVADSFGMAHNAYVNGKLLQLRWSRYFVNLLPPALIGAASCIAWAVARPWVSRLSSVTALVILASIWCLTYASLTAKFNREVLATVGSVFRRGKRDAATLQATADPVGAGNPP